MQLDQLGSAHSLRARVEQSLTSAEAAQARERSLRDSIHDGGHPKAIVVPFVKVDDDVWAEAMWSMEEDASGVDADRLKPAGMEDDSASTVRQSEIMAVKFHAGALQRRTDDRRIKHYDRLFWRFGHVTEMAHWQVSKIPGNKTGDSSQWETDCDNTYVPPGEDAELCFRAPKEWFLYGDGDPSQETSWDFWQTDWECPVRPYWWNMKRRWWEHTHLMQYFLMSAEGRQAMQRILDGREINGRRVVGYCLYVNFLRKIDEGKDKDEVLDDFKRGTPEEDPFGFPYRIMCEAAPTPDLNPALYNQNCKYYKGGVEQDVFNSHEASEAGRIYRAKRRKITDYGCCFTQTEGSLGLAADMVCDPLDPDKRFGQEVRAALQATNAAINVAEEKQKRQDQAIRMNRALQAYDLQPGPVHIKDDFSLFGMGAYSQFYRVEVSELLGEVSQFNGKEQVVSSSTISMVGEALSTTWINAYARAASRPTSSHYRRDGREDGGAHGVQGR